MSDFITNAELRIEAERLCDENDQLKAENAKLRKDFESVGTAAYLYGRSDLKAENAKLRNLCRDMLKTIRVMDEEWHSLTDFTTMSEASETYDFDAENAPEYEEKLRDLGVEVDA